MEIKVKLLYPGCDILFPVKSYEDDACYDVRSAVDAFVPAHSTQAIPLGFAIQLPQKWECQIRPRSGKTLEGKFQVALGTVDCGYVGQVHALVYNCNDTPIVIDKYEKIAQMAIKKIYDVELVPGDIDNNTARGHNGFGSTDQNK